MVQAEEDALGNNQLWSDKYKPKHLNHILVNRSKINELQCFLLPYQLRANTVCKPSSNGSASPPNGKAPESICILQGPSGCGKSSTLNIICEQLGLQIIEWNTPSEANGQKRNLRKRMYEQISYKEEEDMSLSESFLEFLRHSLSLNTITLRDCTVVPPTTPSPSRVTTPRSSPQSSGKGVKLLPRLLKESPIRQHPSPAVLNSQPQTIQIPNKPKQNPLSRNHVVLLRELPYTLLQHSQSFTKSLHTYIQSFLSTNAEQRIHLSKPFVLCITKSIENQKRLRQFMPHGALTHPAVKIIDFIGFSSSAVKKVLLNVLEKESYTEDCLRLVGTSIESLVEQSNGDLRMALNSLQFALIGVIRRHDIPLNVPLTKSSLKRKKGSTESTKHKTSNISDTSNILKTAMQGCCVLSRKDEVWSIHHAVGKFLWSKRLPVLMKGGNVDGMKDMISRQMCTPSPVNYTQKLPSTLNQQIVRKIGVEDTEGENVLSVSHGFNGSSQPKWSDEILFKEEEMCVLLQVLDHEARTRQYTKNIGAENNRNKIDVYTGGVGRYASICDMHTNLSKTVVSLNQKKENNSLPFPHMENPHANIALEFEDSWGWAMNESYEVCMHGLPSVYDDESGKCGLLSSQFESNEVILEPKQLTPSELFPKSERPPLYFKPETIIKETACDVSTFVELLHDNYVSFYGNVTDVASVASHLAYCDAYFGDAVFGGYSRVSRFKGVVYEYQLWYFSSLVGRSILDCNLNPQKITNEGKFNITRDLSVECNIRMKNNKQRWRELMRFEGDVVMGGMMNCFSKYSSYICFVEILPTVHKLMRLTCGEYKEFSAPFMDFLVALNRRFDEHTHTLIHPIEVNEESSENQENESMMNAAKTMESFISCNDIFGEAGRLLECRDGKPLTDVTFMEEIDLFVDDIEEIK